MLWNDKNLIRILKGNGVAVMPTDTLYGVLGRAQDSATVERIYTLRKRNPDKPCIILIGDISELEKFPIKLSEEQKNKLEEFWPAEAEASAGQQRAMSIVLDCSGEKFSYLHRGTKTLAFRLPTVQELRDLLIKVGPLVAPSANPEGLPPAENINEAKKYFVNLVDMYVDGGTLKGKASKVIKLHKDGAVSILRE